MAGPNGIGKSTLLKRLIDAHDEKAMIHKDVEVGYYSQDFVADIRDWEIKNIEFNSLKDINDTLMNRFNFNQNASESYRMGLPTSLSLQIDYNIGSGFYVNFTPYFALRKGTNMLTKISFQSFFCGVGITLQIFYNNITM